MNQESAIDQKTAAWAFLVLFAMFGLQAILFTAEFRPDEGRALSTFLGLFARDDSALGEIWTRTCLLGLDLLFTLLLAQARLIDGRTIVVAAVWPLTAFLFSKIYWEFFVFPLCLIRVDTRPRTDVMILAGLAVLLVATNESNLGIVMAFRAVLLMQKIGPRYAVPIAVIVAGLIADAAFPYLADLPVVGDAIRRFEFTRTIVNPEYSIFETFLVFAASFHFFSLHDGAYLIDAAFTIIVVLLIANSRASWANFRLQLPAVIAVIAVLVFFTSITHAFQNARYYYFFVPVLAQIVPLRLIGPLAVLGFAHVVIRGFVL